MPLLRPFAPLLFSALLVGCTAGHPLRQPDPPGPGQEGQGDEHLEVHLLHLRMALEAHEAAVRFHQQGALPPTPPAP
jgi:hypothetical protein